MVPLTSQLDEFGRTLREYTKTSPQTDRVIAGARRRLHLSIHRRDQGSVARRVAPWMAAAAVVACIATWAAWPTPNQPLSVALETESAPLVGRWVTSDQETKQLRFSDGTSVSLHPQTKLRVDQTTERGATVVLGQGRTLAQIVHESGADWKFLAGPFTVQVTGTEFDLSWDPREQVLELALHQGSVALRGPTLQGARKVHKGEFVRLRVPRGDPSMSASGPATSGPAEDGRDAPTRAKPKPTSGPNPPTADGPSDASAEKDKTEKDKAADGETWQGLLAAGKRDAALAAIDRVGSENVLRSASAEDLWSLSRAARIAGRATLAKDALLALRNKHGSRGQTSYLLGKVHADQLRQNAEAIRWFETYLNEAPNGALAEQALGRLVELQAGTNRGQRAAKRYLEKYPRGSYADFARSSLR